MISKLRRRFITHGTLVLFVFLPAMMGRKAFAETATLQPSKDATLIESATGNLANGSGPAIFAGRISASTDPRRRALLAFDIAGSIPAGSVITGVTLSLNLSQMNAGPVTIRLHKVIADWGEGPSIASGGGGALSMPGDSTWLHRFYADLFWAVPGGDFDLSPSANAAVDQPGVYAWGSTVTMVSDVQGWLDHAQTNFGWMLIGDETRPTTVKRFDSREALDAGSRPHLEVEFLPPCVPDPRGPGFWRHQCAAILEEGWSAPARRDFIGGPAVESRASASPDADSIQGYRLPSVEAKELPHFAESILPCAQRMLRDLGLSEPNACESLLDEPPWDCRQLAQRKLSVLVFNVCGGFFQSTCPVSTEACLSTSLTDLLEEIAALIQSGDCRQASECASLPE
jgi:hypothetical protein